jgi:uncharacterized membrane protein YdbT with pleckstrin-like domain
MGYVENSLMKGEQIEYNAKLHWIIFVWPAFLLLIALNLLISGSWLGFLILLSLASLDIFIKLYTTELVLTNKRLVVKTGLIRRTSFEILLSKVESIGLEQPILGRILDYGWIVVIGTGASQNRCRRIANPTEFRTRIQEQIEMVQNK